MKPIAVISTDWHISTDNVGLSLNLATQQIQLAKEVGVRRLWCLGDIFESQRSQPEIVLNCFKDILDKIGEAGMELWSIAGNHDKTDRYSWDSFLRPFTDHPAFHLFESSQVVQFDENNDFLFLSYIKEPLWIEELKKYEFDPDKHIYLFSHQCMQGSVNNDGSKRESRINAGLLRPFEKCFFGHYHNEQQPIPNALHCASWKQKDFGENNKKGFYVLGFDDRGILDTEFRKSEFPEYRTIEIPASDVTGKFILGFEGAEELKNGTKVRLVIKGSLNELKSISIAKLTELGIKVKKVDTAIASDDEEEDVITDYSNGETLKESFRDFCTENNYPYEEGLSYLVVYGNI